MDLGEIPSMWRQAKVVSIFKEGNKALMSNYRSVSLTSIVGKLLESIIANKIREHLEKFSFTNLLTFYRNVYEGVVNNANYDIKYLDFSKAFDKVPHDRLRSKVRAHRIDGKVLRWIRSWLSNKQQRVTIDGSKSNWGGKTSGVPQGSVLGPLLFIIYINDLDNGISSDISKFADDSKIGRIIKSESDVKDLQGDLDRLNEWMVKWQMDFNIDKCKVVNIGRKNPQNRYINRIMLNRSECERDLGVQVSLDLRPRKQCIEVRNMANRLLGFITRSIKSRSVEVILKLYLVLVRPHLDYAMQFWSLYYRIILLESVQRRMTKMIEGIHNVSYERRLKLLKLHSLERRRVRGDLIEIFKWVNGFNKRDVRKVLTISSQDRTRNNGFKLEKCNLIKK